MHTTFSIRTFKIILTAKMQHYNKFMADFSTFNTEENCYPVESKKRKLINGSISEKITSF